MADGAGQTSKARQASKCLQCRRIFKIEISGRLHKTIVDHGPRICFGRRPVSTRSAMDGVGAWASVQRSLKP
ncbi:hypothetical protein AJ88_33565 [Mesorhizobium amorphae CCBAU 01583]|nr:hypothetical protein AJ88_33565 [Mesorhizobium amorphae CCBAU 01583]